MSGGGALSWGASVLSVVGTWETIPGGDMGSGKGAGNSRDGGSITGNIRTTKLKGYIVLTNTLGMEHRDHLDSDPGL